MEPRSALVKPFVGADPLGMAASPLPVRAGLLGQTDKENVVSDRRVTVITGSSSGIGAATARLLESAGQRVIGVDVAEADVVVDLGTAAGRASALEQINDRCDGRLDGVVCCAGLSGLTERPGSLLVSVNYFGTVEILTGLQPLLARGDRPAAVAISSNSTTIQPNIPMAVVDALLAGDEAASRELADRVGSLDCYPASKTAVTRWVRRNAPAEQWAGAGITLNAIAPGPIETPLLQASREDPTVGAFVDSLPTPVGRNGTPDEMAALAAFLLGPDARFICGSIFFADGGLDAMMRADDHPVPWVL